MVMYTESQIRDELINEGIPPNHVEPILSVLNADGSFPTLGSQAGFEVLAGPDSTPTDPNDALVKFLSGGTFTGGSFTHLEAVVFNTDDNVTVSLTNDGTMLARGLVIEGTGTDSITMTGNAAHYISAGSGSSNIVSGAGADTIYGGGGGDTIAGGAGADTIVGGTGGSNNLLGQQGADVIYSYGDSDTMVGGKGNDKFVVQDIGNQHESINGGMNTDTVFFTGYDKSDLSGPITHHGQGANKTFVLTFHDGTTVQVRQVETLVFEDGTKVHLH